MEQKKVMLSALSLGVGVGIGLASGSQAVINRLGTAQGITAEQIELELQKLIVGGKDSHITFHDFPYYLSERTQVLLTSAAYVHLNNFDMSKHTRNLSPASRAILLSGPTEIYVRVLARALAQHFGSKLLLLDMSDFSVQSRSKYGTKRESLLKRSIPEATFGRVSTFLEYLSILPTSEDSRAPPKRISNWSFDEKVFLQALYKVITSASNDSSIILYVRDIEKVLLSSPRFYKLFDQLLKKLSGSVVVLGSRVLSADHESTEIDEKLNLLFPYNIEITPPEEESHLGNWKVQLEEDTETIQFHDNRNHIVEVLAANDLECDDLRSICHAHTTVLSNYIEEIVVSAISYHMMNNRTPEYRNGKLIISSDSLSHGLSIFREIKCSGKYSLELDSSKGTEGEKIVCTEPGKSAISENKDKIKKDDEILCASKASEASDNAFEKRIRAEVIPANKIGVTFGDIGALDEIKESLQELVMLPLRRPDLFKGGLLKPCRGILLFGPPGTGKTMLAKAIANEAGASFINVSMATITSKWFGEDEKNVRALFTLAAKVAPAIIFVDEVDSMLGQRTKTGEHEAMRKIKNEFMTLWDGLLTNSGEQILVLAATNRPFDLDEAIIRRFERRVMVGLPSAESREKILKTLLAKECIEDLDFKELATMTEGYSGSDLKNLCVTAAYRPVRELIQQERQKDMEKKKRVEDATRTNDAAKEEREITLRPLNMEDMKEAKKQVAASFASEGSVMSELKQWNELYGEGGSRKREQLSYFL